MAKTTHDEFHIGTDFQRLFHIKNSAEDTAIDISGWALSYKIKQFLSDADNAALVTKTTSSGISIGGTFNSSPGSNAQRATLTIEDTDTTSINPGLYFYELKRTDAGFETVLAEGTIEAKAAVHIA